jgi:hypothetical protein
MVATIFALRMILNVNRSGSFAPAIFQRDKLADRLVENHASLF